MKLRTLQRLAPCLRRKALVIRNGLDTDGYAPTSMENWASRGPFAFCAAGTLSRVKKSLRVVEAVAELRRRGGWERLRPVACTWHV